MMLPVGQLFVIGFHGHTLDASTRALLQEHNVGGVILFKRNIDTLEQVVDLNTQLYDATAGGDALVVSVDQEGGRVARLRGIMTDVSAMRAVGQLAESDPDIARKVGAMMGRELVALGFHWDFAPVVDVDTNAQNPVIGERSFSRDPHAVARLGEQFIAGLQGSGVAASAKHFPGHGDTDTDSHHALPSLSHSLQRLREVELVPFARAIKADVASVMTAHVMFPALDPALPATLSAAIINTLLREELRYDGVVVSDDLEMAAVADNYGIEELVRLGLLAGVDAFLICHDADKQQAAIEATHRLVESGKVPRARVEQAIVRVATMKQRYVGKPAPPSLSQARRIVRSDPHRALAETLSALTVADTRAASPVDVG